VTEETGETRLLVALRRMAAALDARGQQWALVGGLAVSVRTEPRFTRDIDLAVAVASDEAAESLVAGLVGSGFRLLLSLEHQALGRLAAVRLLPPGEPEAGVVIDLLFSSSGIEEEICRDAERLDVSPGLTVAVAQTGHLVVMKLLATAPDRPQDDLDLRALVAVLTPLERVRARAAALRIEEVGANRSKPLTRDLERWLVADGP
jgi:predicted nucleotidyltransferase